MKTSPSLLRRAARWAVPVAAASLAVLVATDGWAAKPKKKPASQTAPAPASAARPRTTPPAAGHAQPRRRPSQPTSQPAARPARRRGHRGHAAEGSATTTARAEMRAESYARQGRGVTEGELPPVVDGAACPADMANIDSRFCVDKYEGALVQILPGNQERAWSAFEMVADGVSVRAISVPGVTPQAYISGAQAESACKASGKRLCKPVEWRTACMGPQKKLWGYGETKVARKCNDHGRAPMGHFYPQVGISWRLVGMTEMNDPQLNQLEGTLMKTGEKAECTNEYGVYDMVGNLHEWTNDPHGTFQGGYYLDTHQNGDGCGYRTTAHEFEYHDYSTGFRCCADATSTSTPGFSGAAASVTQAAATAPTPAMTTIPTAPVLREPVDPYAP